MDVGMTTGEVERDFVQQILLELPPKARAILILRGVQQLGFDEIGTLLGMTPTAVRMALSRARAQFRDRYLHPEEP
jgi:RNA polymerase sigma factor (sigma-70 family)